MMNSNTFSAIKRRSGAVVAAPLLATGLAGAQNAGMTMWEGPGVMGASANGTAIWQFPDKRALDPALFGTPAEPLNVELLPIANRATNADGSAYTTIVKPSMFSNNIKMISGSFDMQVRDLTAKDGKGSKDEIHMVAEFVGPQGRTFRMVMKKIIPKGPDHPFFGGVGANVLMHGGTGIGSPLVTEVFSYITAWGIGDMYIDGELVDQGRVMHIMVSERTRDDDFKIGFGVANPDQLEIHLAMPPLKGSPTGPVASAVPTGVMLPNGKEQPFIHANFYGDASVTGNRFVMAGG